MKNVKNWEKFNELNNSTYRRASELASDYGREDLSKRFKDHSKEMRDRENISHQDKFIKSIISSGKSIEIFASDSGSVVCDINYFTGESLDLIRDNEYDVTLTFFLYNRMTELTMEMYISETNGKLTMDIICSEGDPDSDTYTLNRSGANTLRQLVGESIDELINEIDDSSLISDQANIIKNLPIHGYMRPFKIQR